MNKLISLVVVVVGAAVAAPFAVGHATVSLLQPQGKALTAARTTYILRVPNERATQSTFSVTMTVPEAVQRAISVKQMPDWKITLKRVDTGEKNAEGSPVMATQSITWKAKKGNMIAPGFYGEFQFRLQNPATPQKLCFPANQWYTSKLKGGKSELVAWTGDSSSATPASCVDVVAN